MFDDCTIYYAIKMLAQHAGTIRNSEKNSSTSEDVSQRPHK